MTQPETGITVKINPKVGVGISTIVGFGAAAAQYLGVLIGLLDDNSLSLEELGVLGTATATLVVTIKGRMDQAREMLRENKQS